MSIHRLTPAQIAKITAANKDGKFGDGGGLYLQMRDGSASWIFRYKRDGKEKQMGLGPLHTTNLTAARTAAESARIVVRQNRDPIIARDRATTDSAMTFDEAAKQFFAVYRHNLKGRTTPQRHENSIARYASPIIGTLPVAEIESSHILQVLQPIWQTKTETASGLRGRLEKIFDWAIYKKHRSASNPAKWKGVLSNDLPSVETTRTVKHMKALPGASAPEFIAKLRQHNGISAAALEFTVLTACRGGDIKGQDSENKPPLRWRDLDLDNKVWTIPNTKTGLAHYVPLSTSAIALLERVRAFNLDDDLVFPSTFKPGQPLKHNALAEMAKIASGDDELTAHGFRATFKTWAEEQTDARTKVIEAVLAHGLIKGGAVAKAYMRADFFAERVPLMQAWADHCEGRTVTASLVPSNIIKLRPAA